MGSRLATNRARVWINGRTYWLGKWDSPEASLASDRLIAEYLANGRVDAWSAEPRQAKPAPVAKETVEEIIPEALPLPNWRRPIWSTARSTTGLPMERSLRPMATPSRLSGPCVRSMTQSQPISAPGNSG